MKTLLLALALAVALTAVGCSSRQKKMEQKVAELAAKPAATELSAAKALYDEASKLVAWLETHPGDATPETLGKARALCGKRALEIGKIAGEKALKGIQGILGGFIGAVAPTGVQGGMSVASVRELLDKMVEEILGVGTPKHKEFGCNFPAGVTPLTEGASKYCP